MLEFQLLKSETFENVENQLQTNIVTFKFSNLPLDL